MNDELPSGQLQNYITDVKDSWQPNKGLNILTGVNGSGKTRLLDYIYSFIKPGASLLTVLGMATETKAHLKFKFAFIPIPGEGFRPLSNPIRMEYVPVLWRTYADPPFRHDVINDQSGMPIQDSHLAENGSLLMTHATLSYKIKTIPNINKSIAAYQHFVAIQREKINTFKQYPNTQDAINQVETEIETSNPLLKIQEAFKSFPEHINLQVKVPTVSELESDITQVQFLSKDTGLVIDPESLSSGEKIIVYLLVSEQMGLFGNLDVLLLDELDAHLNPALIKVYVDVLYRIVKAGVQVIATTHNPIVVNYVEPKDIWWMDKCEVCNQTPALDEHKRTIVNRLSDGLFSAKDIQGIFSLFTEPDQTHEWIFLVEGRHDVITLLTQFIHELCPEKQWPVINCKGADNVEIFTNLPYREKFQQQKLRQKIICLFDNDLQGQQAKNKLLKNLKTEDGIQISEKFKNQIYPLLVSDIEGQRMEEVLKSEKQKQNLKNKLIKLVK
jgi:ABC-type cobalamin/Fe3+-siderophores transport system ATPase subunit/5S rRNA maturation endonuclease (ribonuclease M5)